ncbi:ROK family protein [Nocardioides panacisoli]|uniref:ROK family protein n=1 Tax=Nocardioides panacisoli TaxID=627624 RepID=UPI001C630B3B|nr:ROK family protein [Nocardioides panacisoli]QYJ04667.1 ROK family protein [Nocardioides panacisoli]
MTHVPAPGPVLGVDIGGTKVLAVELGPEAGVVAATHVPMPGRDASEREVEDALTAAVTRLAAGREVAAVGVAAAGLVDAERERLRFAAHLPWRDAPVRRRLADRWGTSVVLDNDANCAAYAESAAGAARGAGSALMITLGTGIGGAILLDGALVRGANGMAGEFGHVQVVPDGLPCECGLRGCWEQYCSGRALERVMRVAVGSHLDGPEISARARAGDHVARGAFDAIGTWLGVGIAGLASSFDPALVVVGGGVSAGGDLLLEPARAALADSLQAADRRTVPPVVPAAFGAEAGALGAALLAASGRRAGPVA